MTSGPLKTFALRDLEIEVIEPKEVVLTRLYRHAGGDWDPPPEAYRNLRVDPPAGSKGRFAVLYTADCIQAVAAECRILQVQGDDSCTWSQDLAAQYKVVRYDFAAPALFVPIDGANRRVLNLSGPQRSFSGYEPYQAAALELFERLGTTVHGLSWESFHRNQPGRVYALWHSHKTTIGLQRRAAAVPPFLVDDAEWLAFLNDNPQVEAIAPK
jgi:hypothetical protein